MARITLQVIDGADRGRVYADMSTPVSIGREEGNTIQLNDERVSRYHLKIQEDHDKIVVTDLESTNGTKINGEEVQLRIVRPGDVITVGRSVLLFGSREEISQRLAKLREADSVAQGTIGPEEAADSPEAESLDFELNFPEDPKARATLQTVQAPDLPERLSPGQRAQLAELIEFLHLRIRNLINGVTVDSNAGRVSVDARKWQSLLDLQARLSAYLRSVGEPPKE